MGEKWGTETLKVGHETFPWVPTGVVLLFWGKSAGAAGTHSTQVPAAEKGRTLASARSLKAVRNGVHDGVKTTAQQGGPSGRAKVP